MIQHLHDFRIKFRTRQKIMHNSGKMRMWVKTKDLPAVHLYLQ